MKAESSEVASQATQAWLRAERDGLNRNAPDALASFEELSSKHGDPETDVHRLEAVLAQFQAGPATKNDARSSAHLSDRVAAVASSMQSSTNAGTQLRSAFSSVLTRQAAAYSRTENAASRTALSEALFQLLSSFSEALPDLVLAPSREDSLVAEACMHALALHIAEHKPCCLLAKHAERLLGQCTARVAQSTNDRLPKSHAACGTVIAYACAAMASDVSAQDRALASLDVSASCHYLGEAVRKVLSRNNMHQLSVERTRSALYLCFRGIEALWRMHVERTSNEDKSLPDVDHVIDHVLDFADAQISAASRATTGASTKTATLLHPVAISLHGAHGAVVLGAKLGGSHMRARIRALAASLALQASTLLGLVDKDSPTGSREPDQRWEWELSAQPSAGLARPLHTLSDLDATTLLCEQLVCVLADCAVERRPAATITNPFGMMPSRTNDASHCEQIAAVLCLGRMAMLAAKCDDADVLEAVARLVVTSYTESLATATFATVLPFGRRVYSCIARSAARVMVPLVARGQRWVFDSIFSVLLRSYNDADHGLGAMFMFQKHGKDLHARGFENTSIDDEHGVLADCLEIIADDLDKVHDVQFECSQRLLSLATDLGLLRGLERCSYDLVALLPALTSSCRAAHRARLSSLNLRRSMNPKQISFASGSAHAKGPSIVLSSLEALRADDATSVRLFRNVWLYCGLLGLHRTPPRWLEGWDRAPRCLTALGALAGSTPVLMYGTGQQAQQETEQRVQLEMLPHLRAAGKLGEPASVVSSLTKLLAPHINASAVPQANPSNAFLLAIAALEVNRAESGALPADAAAEDAPPLLYVLAYQAGALANSVDSRVFNALAHAVGAALTERLTSNVDRSDDDTRFRNLEALADVLIREGAPSAARDGASGGSIYADALRTLTNAAPSLHYSQACIASLLDTSPGNPLLKKWLEEASERAPTAMEHQLFEQLCVSEEPGCLKTRDHNLTDMLTAIARGRGRSGLISYTLVGVEAIAAKSVAIGRAAVLHSVSNDIEERLVSSLLTLADGETGAWGFAQGRLVLDAAAVIVARHAAGDAMPARALHAIAHAPLRRFCGASLHDAAFAWHWVTSAFGGICPPLLAQIAQSWQFSVTRGLGLFSGPWRAPIAPLSGGDLLDWSPDAVDSELLRGLEGHHTWALVLLELWEASRHASLFSSSSTVLALFHSIVQAVVSSPTSVTTHPLARPALCRLLSLCLRICRHILKYSNTAHKALAGTVAGLIGKAVSVALRSFAHGTQIALRSEHDRLRQESVRAVQQLARDVKAFRTNKSGTGHSSEGHVHGSYLCCAAPQPSDTDPSSPWMQGERTAQNVSAQQSRRLDLLLAFLEHEAVVQAILLDPLAEQPACPAPSGLATTLLDTAWAESPALAHALAARFSYVPDASAKLSKLTYEHRREARTRAWPAGGRVLAQHVVEQSSGAKRGAQASKHEGGANVGDLAALDSWAPAPVVDALGLLAGVTGDLEPVQRYVMRSMSLVRDEELVFWLPQIMQALRRDSGELGRFLLDTATEQGRWMFLHKLIWALETEERPDESEFNPEIKRSGWQPPADTGLWQPCADLKARILDKIPPADREYFEAEHGTFAAVTAISGILKPVPKDERRSKIAEAAEEIELPDRNDLYLPVDSRKRLIKIIPSSGRPMQSAAKTPIMLAFEVEALPSDADKVVPHDGSIMKQACIFKVGDDCRQDVLALQVITLLRNAFKVAGLPLYLHPYGVLPTGYEKGILQMVPNTKSRAGLGEVTDGGLFEIFQARYGAPATPAFEEARKHFILSEAGYAIASYILQSKDRHNGNILLDELGRIVHIDFGFIFEISPGGNMGFESAAFKFSYEMVQLIDPGGTKTSATYQAFKEHCVRGFIAARTVAEDILAVATLMAASGLPCYSRGKPLENLKARFRLHETASEAAQFMRMAVDDAYNKWTTSFYDFIQVLQNDIPY